MDLNVLQLKVYLMILVAASVLTGVLAVYVFLKRKAIKTPSLFGLLLAISIWCFAVVNEILSVSLDVKRFFNIISSIGIILVPVFLFLFTLEYTQNINRFKRYAGWLLWIVPILSFVFLVTNNYHHLFFTESHIEVINGIRYHFVSHGLWWLINSGYSYLLILLSIVLLIRMLVLCSPIQRKVIWVLLFGVVLSLFSNILYIIGVKPLGFIDITPVAFLVTGAIFFWGIYSKRLFRVKPIALNTLFDNLPAGIIVINSRKEVVDVNASAVLMLGLTTRNPLGMQISDVLPYSFNFDNSKAFNKIHLVKYNNCYIEAEHSIIADEGGGNLGYIVLLNDVTRRYQSEIKLKAATERLQLASQVAGLDAWENDLVTGNRLGGEKIYNDLGYFGDDMPDTMNAVYELIHPDDLPGVMSSLESHFKGETPVYEKDFRLRDIKGNYQWVANYARVVERDNMGKPIRFIGITLNVDQRKKTEEKIRKQNDELLRVNAEKDKFFSIIAHDLRSPFQGFIGLTELMLESSSIDKQEVQSIVQSLHSTAKNLYELLENLLSWAMVKRGKKSFSPQKLNLASAVMSVTDIFTQLLSQKNISLNNTIADNLFVLADRESVKTIFRNIISNAIKFTPSGGAITLNAQLISKGFLQIMVADTGVGMPPQIKNNLFSLTTKVSRPGTNNEPSTGLGLMLCKELVGKHGGSIWVESVEGTGSQFYFTLPVSS